MSEQTAPPISAAEAFRRARDQGTYWTAPSGIRVKVRELDIADEAVLDRFPDNLRQTVYRIVERSAGLRGDPQPEDDSLFAGLTGEELIRAQAELADRICQLTWIDPEIVETVTDPERQVTLDDVPKMTRRAYMTYVFGMQAQEAQSLSRFPGRPSGDVGPLPAGEDVRPATERVPGPGAAILRADGV